MDFHERHTINLIFGRLTRLGLKQYTLWLMQKTLVLTQKTLVFAQKTLVLAQKKFVLTQKTLGLTHKTLGLTQNTPYHTNIMVNWKKGVGALKRGVIKINDRWHCNQLWK